VLHPGICPEYRNAHGCFWAIVRRDLDKVGLTLLRIDRGIDTGPIFGYFRAAYDERSESHRVIQDRMLLDNLDAIRDCFRAIAAGVARPLSVAGRASATWGQPRFTSYLSWKRAMRRGAPVEHAPALVD
jgi:methionyl-tRNA formyltransferase